MFSQVLSKTKGNSALEERASKENEVRLSSSTIYFLLEDELLLARPSLDPNSRAAKRRTNLKLL